MKARGVYRELARLQWFSEFLQSSWRKLQYTEGTHTEQMLRGSIWAFADHVLEQFLALLRSVILARWFLGPSDFGLLNIAALLTAALLILTETGLWPALIQRKELKPETLYTSWWIFAFRGVFLAGMIVLLAPVGARFYQEPLLRPILNVMALQFVVSGFNSLSPILLQRDMDFRLLTYLKVATQLVNLGVSVLLAFILRNFWAVVWGQVAGSLFAAVYSYLIHDFRPRFHFVWCEARSLFHFSKYITLSGIVTYLTTQGDDAYVGKVLGTEPLGFYGLAYRLSNLPATSLSHVINRVTLPAFALLQDDIELLRRRYLQTLRLVGLLAFPLAGGMWVLATPLVGALYGEKWLPIVPSFMVLCAFGLERAIGSVAGPVFLALNRPKLVWWLGLSKLVTMVICIVPLTLRYGILGTSLAVTLSAIVVQCFVILATTRLLHLSAISIFAQLRSGVIGTLLMMIVVWLMQQSTGNYSGFLWLVLLVLLAIVVYGIFIAISEREILAELKSMLIRVFGPVS